MMENQTKDKKKQDNLKLKFKLKQNDSFSLRQGWLQKGLNIVNERNDVFKSDAPVILGLGSNMCKSLRYYMRIFSLTEEKSGTVTLSDFGKCLYKNDRYLEDIFSYYMMHINSLINIHDNTVPYFYFNTHLLSQCTKEDISDYVNDKLKKDNAKPTLSMLNNDVNVMIRNYTEDESNENPEQDAYSSPLSMLSLIKKDGKIFKKSSTDINTLNPLIVFYNILKIADKEEIYGKEINLNTFINRENNPVYSLNLTENTLLYYLDTLDKKGYIALTLTAGLNNIKILKNIDVYTLYEEYRRLN